MSSSKRQLAVGSWQLAVPGRGRRVFYCLLLTAYCLLFIGCRQDMQDQPRYEVYEASPFFKDGLSSRPYVEGTVPRGYLRADKQLYTGKMDKAGGATAGGATNQSGANQSGAQTGEETTSASSQTSGNATGSNTSGQNNGNNNGSMQMGQTGQTGQAGQAAQGRAGEADDAVDFPFPVTAEVVERGRNRYEIFCAMCHSPTGDGDGMIVRRGYRRPPSYHEDRLRQAPVGYFFRVMTEGYGAMPPYRAQVPVQDRWAIAAYIRALQLSQMNKQLAPAHSGAEAQPAAGGHR
jgi:mono/diheme cytochrome c family protein